MVEALYDISIHLYNTNALEYALIAQSGPISMIHDIEGLYNKSLLIKNPPSKARGFLDSFF